MSVKLEPPTIDPLGSVTPPPVAVRPRPRKKPQEPELLDEAELEEELEAEAELEEETLHLDSDAVSAEPSEPPPALELPVQAKVPSAPLPPVRPKQRSNGAIPMQAEREPLPADLALSETPAVPYAHLKEDADDEATMIMQRRSTASLYPRDASDESSVSASRPSRAPRSIAAPPVSAVPPMSSPPPVMALTPAPLEPVPPAPSSISSSAATATPIPQPSQVVASSLDTAPTTFSLKASDLQAGVPTPEQEHALKRSAKALVELCERQLKLKPDKHRAARLYYEAARCYEEPLKDLAAAAKYYEAACKLLPDHHPSVRGLRRVQLRLKRYPQALHSYDAELKLGGEASRQASLLYEKGCLLEGKMAQKGEARAAFEAATSHAPQNLSLLKAAAHAQEQAMAWGPLAETFERSANAVSQYPEQQAAFLSQMARTVAVRLKDSVRAIELYKAAMAADPRTPGALSALKGLLYEAGRWGELVGLLEKEAQLTSDVGARSMALFRVGRIYTERLGDLDSGLKALEHASAISPTDRAILSELARVYELAGRYAELANALERLLALESEPTAQALHRLAQLYDEKLGQHDYAIDRYTRALTVEPDYRPSLLNLERLRVQRGEWAELAQMLANQANASVDSEQRAALLSRIAEICEVRLGALEHALDHHRKALEASPGYAASYKALIRLYTTYNKWHELIELYERRLEQELSTPERLSTLFKIGRLEEDALGLPAAAVSTYQRILEVEPNHLEAIECLQRAAERGGRFEELVQALELEAKKTSNVQRQIELLHRAAKVLDEELNDSSKAVEKLNAVLDKMPTYLPAIDTLCEIHHRDQQWEALLGAYTRELNVTKDSPGRSKVEFKMGELCEVNLGRADQAVIHYRKAVQAYGKNLEALAALRRLLTLRGDYKEAVQLLEQEQALVQVPEVVAQLSFLAGEFYENHLDAPDKALACFKSAIELSPSFRPAADAVTRLLEHKHDFKALQQRLSAEIEALTDPLLASQAAYRQAEITRDHLKQLAPAATAFEKVLEWEPSSAGALLSLERLYVQLEDKDKLARLYERQASQLRGAGAQVAAYRAWLRLLEQSADADVEAIKNAYAAILNLEPADIFALLALETIALEQGDRALLQQVDAKLGVAKLDRFSVSAHQTRLAQAMEARGDQSALEVYRAALSHDGENLAAARGISRIAEMSMQPELLAEAGENEALLLQSPQEGARLLVLAAGQLAEAGQPGAASAKLTAALEMDPNNAQAAQLLTTVMGDTADGERSSFLVDAISRAAGAATSPEARAEMWLKVARLHHERTGDNGAAIAAASRAIRETPADTEARMLLADYYAYGGSWKECTAQLQELLKRSPTKPQRLRALLQLAAIENDRLKKPAPAEGHAKAALELDEENREGLAILLRVQLAREQLTEAATTADRLAKVSVSPEEKAEALYQSAKLERHRSNFDKAEQAYIGAVAILGATSQALEEFRGWLEQRGKSADWGTYCRALNKYLQQTGLDTDAKKSAYVELGRAMDRKLGDSEGGLQYMRAALELTPADESLRSEIAERLDRTGQLEAAVEYYLHLVRRQLQYSPHWRALAGCYERLLKIDLARLALAPVVAHGEASAAEQAKYEATPSRTSSLAAGAIGDHVFEAIEQGVKVSGPGRDLIRAVSPALPKLYPAPYERYGVNKANKVTNRSNNSLRHVADKMAGIFGVGEFDMYVHESNTRGISVEFGDHAALFVGADVAAYTEPEQEFAFARAMANIARGLTAVDVLKPKGIITLMVALARQQSSGFGAGLGNEAEMTSLPKKVSKAMPWFSGGKLETAAKSVASAELDLRKWVNNVHITAARAAIVACDDLAVGIRCLEREGTDPALLSEVISYNFTDSAAELRRQLFG